MSSDVQLEQYPRASLDDDLTAAGEERKAFIPCPTKLENNELELIDGGGVARQSQSGDKGDSRKRGYELNDGTRRLQINSGWTKWKLRLREVYENNVGLLFIILSQFCSSCMNISVKMLNGLDPPVPPFELVAIRMLFTYVFSIVYMLHQGVEHPILGPPGVRKLLIFRGVSGFFGLFGMYYSLQYLSLSDAVVLTFLTPTVTAVVGHLVLKETFTRGQTVAGLCSLIGVVLIARPEFLFGSHSQPIATEINYGDGSTVGPAERGTPAQRLGAVGVAMLGVFGATGAVTSLRAIGKRAHTLHSLTYFSSYSIFVSILGMTIFRIPIVIPTQWKWVALFFVIGFFGYGAQLTLVWGLQRETASRGMLAMYVQIIFAAILERIFFHVYPSFLSLLGTGVILSCAIYVALSKKAPQNHSTVRLTDIEASAGSEDTTRAPSLDSTCTEVVRGSADSSVTVLATEDVELYSNEDSEGKRRSNLEKV